VALNTAWVKDFRLFISFFSLACFGAFSDAEHSRFLLLFSWVSKLWLRGSLKMLVLALPQIYTSVFYLWKSIDLDSAKVGYSRPY